MINPHTLTAAMVAMASLFALPSATAGDVVRGETKAAVCVQCHGEGGNKPIADYPKIGGQTEDYLAHTLLAYRSGKRNHVIMEAQVAALSDDDIADLATYFAAQPGDLRWKK